MSTEERAGVFLAFGVPQEDAMAMGAAIDATMAGCILDLYRSATRVQDDWGPDFVDIPKPGMVVVPGDDPFLDAEGSHAGRAAGRGADGAPGRGRPLVDGAGPRGGRGDARVVLGDLTCWTS